MNVINPQLKILIVEDDPIVLFVHQNMLEEMGYQTDAAKTGQEAIRMAAQGYDLIFMDIGLPDISGIEVTAHIREQEQTENRKPAYIVALTAFPLESIRDKCEAVNMNQMLSKPTEAEVIEKLIKSVEKTDTSIVTGTD